ncbi:MAG: hypothetical protein WAL63_03840, partial [Solirubrobacteraceae bacterium]
STTPPLAGATDRLSVLGRPRARGTAVRVRLTCRGPAGTRCGGALALAMWAGSGRHRHAVGVGSRRVRLGAGKRETAKVTLDRRGRRRLTARGALRVRLEVTQGRRVVFRRWLKLHAPARARRRAA